MFDITNEDDRRALAGTVADKVAGPETQTTFALREVAREAAYQALTAAAGERSNVHIVRDLYDAEAVGTVYTSRAAAEEHCTLLGRGFWQIQQHAVESEPPRWLHESAAQD